METMIILFVFLLFAFMWAWKEILVLRTAIRKHRDYRGDDRCYLDDSELYNILPESYTAPTREVAVTIENCQRFICHRSNPGTTYVSPQIEIEKLKAQIAELESSR